MSEAKKGFNFTYGVILAILLFGISGSIVGYTVISAPTTKVCSDFKQTADGKWYCVDDKKVYSCNSVSPIALNEECSDSFDEGVLTKAHVFPNSQRRVDVPVLKNVTYIDNEDSKQGGKVFVNDKGDVFTFLTKKFAGKNADGKYVIEQDNYIFENNEKKTLDTVFRLNGNSRYAQKNIENDGKNILRLENFNKTYIEWVASFSDVSMLNQDVPFQINGVNYTIINHASLGEETLITYTSGNVLINNYSLGLGTTIDTVAAASNSTYKDTYLDCRAAQITNSQSSHTNAHNFGSTTRTSLILLGIDEEEIIGSNMATSNFTVRGYVEEIFGNGLSTFFGMNNWTDMPPKYQAVGNASCYSPNYTYQASDGGLGWLTEPFIDNGTGAIKSEEKRATLRLWDWDGGAQSPHNQWVDFDLAANDSGAEITSMYDELDGFVYIGINSSGAAASYGFQMSTLESGNDLKLHIEFSVANADPTVTLGNNATIDEDASATIIDTNATDSSGTNFIDTADTDGDALTNSIVSQTGNFGGFYFTNNDVLNFVANESANNSGEDTAILRMNDGTTTVDYDINITVEDTNDAVWTDIVGNTTASIVKVSSIYYPIGINASAYCRDVEDDQTPTNITSIDSSSTADCFMNTGSGSDNNFSYFCKNSIAETWDVTFTCSDGSTTAKESFQVTSEPTYTSIFAANFTVDDFQFSTDTFSTFANISFNTSKASTFLTVLSSFNWEKLSGGSSDIDGRLTVDGNIVFSGSLKQDLSINKQLSSAISPFDFEVANGEHSLEIQVKRTGSGVVEVTDVKFSLIEFVSTQDSNVTHGIANITAQHTSTSFAKIFEFIETDDRLTMKHFHYAKLNVDKETGGNVAVHYQLDTLNSSEDVSPFASRLITGASDTAHVLTGFIGKAVGSHTLALLGKLDSADTVNVNGSLLVFDERDDDENVINSFQATNNNSAFNDTLGLTAGNNTLASVLSPLKNGTGMFLMASISSQSTSAGQTPVYWINSTDCYAKEERDLANNNDIATTIIMFKCNSNGTYDLNIDVPAGETLDILDESFSGFEVSDLNIAVLGVPPIPNEFILPNNNSNLSSPSNVTWNIFDGATSYNLGLYYENLSFVSNIVSGFTDNSTNVTWQDFEDGNYSLIITGINSVGSVNNTEIQISIDNTAPAISLETLNNTIQDYSGNSRFIFNVTDAHDVSNCSVRLDSNIIGTIIDPAKDSSEQVSVLLPKASYLWNVSCTDALNNSNTSLTFLYTQNYIALATGSGAGGKIGGGEGCFPLGWKCVSNSDCCFENCVNNICEIKKEIPEEDEEELEEGEAKESFFSKYFGWIINAFRPSEERTMLTITGETPPEPSDFKFSLKSWAIKWGIILGSIIAGIVLLYFFGSYLLAGLAIVIWNPIFLLFFIAAIIILILYLKNLINIG